MPQLEEMSNQGNSLEQIINLLYNIGYRLTGSHKLTQELLTDVINALHGNLEVNIALENLCLLFKSKTTANLIKKSTKAKISPEIKDNNLEKIQQTLLTLPPTERLVLILREILGLNYFEIAKVVGMERITVTTLLNAARWELRKRLAPTLEQRKPH